MISWISGLDVERVKCGEILNILYAEVMGRDELGLGLCQI